MQTTRKGLRLIAMLMAMAAGCDGGIFEVDPSTLAEPESVGTD